MHVCIIYTHKKICIGGDVCVTWMCILYVGHSFCKEKRSWEVTECIVEMWIFSRGLLCPHYCINNQTLYYIVFCYKANSDIMLILFFLIELHWALLKCHENTRLPRQPFFKCLGSRGEDVGVVFLKKIWNGRYIFGGMGIYGNYCTFMIIFWFRKCCQSVVLVSSDSKDLW